MRYGIVLGAVCAAGLVMVTGLFSGCLSLVEKTGRVLDGSAFAEKTLAVYRTEKTADAGKAMEIRELQSRAGERLIGITINRFPSMELRGPAPDADGGFYLTSLEFLGSSVAGWNEYTLDISGTGTMVLGANSATLRIPQPADTSPQIAAAQIAAAQISRGRIHRYDTRITGEEALTNLRNRRERLLVLAEWMNAREDAPRGLGRKDFEKYWKPILLPEMVSGGKRPAGWRQETDQWVRAEDIRWNTGYTERVFPEELWAVRNSGTLLRDWEEAPGWIYLEYEWERICELLSQENTLQRIK